MALDLTHPAFGAGLVAFVGSLLLTPLARAWSRHLGMIDVPNDRSSHSIPTPRSGGQAMVVALAAAFAVAAYATPFGAFVAVLAAVPFATLSGFIDDRGGIREWQKLLLQLIASAVFLLLSRTAIEQFDFGRWTLPLAILAVPITVFWLIGFTNVFNFMDGINGIASLQAIVAGVVLALLAWRHGDTAGVVMAVGVAAVAAGFLPWNLTGTIFMGDTGSATLGFLIAALAVRLAPHGFVAAALPVLPFVFDASLTLGRRIANGETWFKAHRSHLYQRLTDLRWSHAQVSALWAALAAVCGGVALAWERIGGIAALLGLLVLHALVAFAILTRHGASR